MKNAVKFLFYAFVALSIVAVPSFAGQYLGGIGFMHTNSAKTLPVGAMNASLYIRGYFDIKDSDNYITQGASAFAGTFGFTNNAEISFTQLLYQDLTYTRNNPDAKLFTTLGDFYLRFKFGNHNFNDNLVWGHMPSLRYRSSDFYDYFFEPYKGSGIEFEYQFLLSYYEKPLFPDDALSAHFNIGYLNHNDRAGLGSSSQSINYLASFMRPVRNYEAGLELYGSMFIKEPDQRMWGNHSWMYIAPMARYRMFAGLNFTAAFDINVMGNSETDNNVSKKWGNYPKWRLSGKITYTPSTAFYKVPTFSKVATGAEAMAPSAAGRERRSYTRATNETVDRKELFRWAIEERSAEVDPVELDLDKIKRERMKAEEELKRLKSEIEARQAK